MNNFRYVQNCLHLNFKQIDYSMYNFKNGFFFFILFVSQGVFSQVTLDDEALKTWWQKDLEHDSIPGIGLQRLYDEFLQNREGEEVIVAVLDTKLDIDHEDLKQNIWVNEDEIAGNGIDDDHNGYIDDINGWNFLGNANGDEVPYQSTEMVRIIKRYETKYANVDINTISGDETYDYLSAKKELEKKQAAFLEDNHYLDSISTLYFDWKKQVVKALKGKPYSKETLDSLASVDKDFKDHTNWMKDMIDWGIEEEGFLQTYIDENNQYLNTHYSVAFDERKNVDIGNGNVKGNDMPFQHSTPVTGVIAASRDNGIGINGIVSKIKIMPVVMVSDGDEHDEDVAKAIRYATDNGAKIINMSWGKYYSTQPNLVKEAIAYAAKKDVFMVTASGNGAKNIDEEPNFPTDFYDQEEASNNFIKVGGISPSLDATFVASFSNYGKSQVDIMAPAVKIYTTDTENSYKTTRGTSYASPMVAGTAALLKSYFPYLTAAQLKEIILSSGTKLDLMVKRPGNEEGDALVPFSSLSKTGSILNVYAAFQKAMVIEKYR